MPPARRSLRGRLAHVGQLDQSLPLRRWIRSGRWAQWGRLHRLVPLALRGVRYRAIGASAILNRFLWIYGVGGIVVPFIGIKLIDLVLVALGLA